MTPPSDSFQDRILDAAQRLQACLVRYASRFLDADAERAQDVVQHAFLQLCRCGPQQRPDRIDPWLYRVCRNRAIDLQRAAGRITYGHAEKLFDGVDARNVEAIDSASEAELHDLVMQRLAQLPEAQREAIELWADGMTSAEIAEILDRPESSVRVLIHRGLKALRNDSSLRTAAGLTESEPSSARALKH